MSMRTVLTKTMVFLAAALGGCGAVDGGGGGGGGTDPAQPMMTVVSVSSLPSCRAVAMPNEPIAVEDLLGTEKVIVRVGASARALCLGTLDDLGRGDLHRTAPLDPTDPASSDPMPATGGGDGKGSSDPMPASGDHPGNSDPMPADGHHPTSASTGKTPFST